MKNTRLLVQILTGMFGRWVTVIDRAEYEQQENEYQRKLAECEKMILSLQVDREEYDYLKHLADTLVRLEKRLHNTDNASEILKETFRTACEFYGADWAGFLEVDMEGGNTPRNYLNCVQMMELYEDDIRIDSANEAINNIIRHYRSRFLEVVEKLIHILYASKLYNDIRQVADKGLKIEPCNPVMYFWLIVCSHETSMLTTERDYMEEARKHLVEEEYAEMLEKLAEFGVKI